MKKKITIITVCYNASEGLRKTISSVISQTYPEKEYIVIDGGSTDGSLGVIREHQNSIDKWVSEPDNGIYDAMNKGIKMASGEWLLMMNAGDVFAESDVLKKIFNTEIPESKTFLYSDVYGIRPNGRRIIRRMSFEDGILIHQGILYRRSLHDEHGLYIVTPKIIISDYLFFIRIPEEQVLKLDTIISVYEGGGISAQGSWSLQQSYCADVVFRRKTFEGMVLLYYWKKIKSLIPIEVKDKIKIFCGISGNV